MRAVTGAPPPPAIFRRQWRSGTDGSPRTVPVLQDCRRSRPHPSIPCQPSVGSQGRSAHPTRTAAAAPWMGRRGARSPLPPTMRRSRRQRRGLPVEPHPLRCQAVAPGRWKAGTAGITPCPGWAFVACPQTLRMPSTRLSPDLSTPLWTTPTRAHRLRTRAPRHHPQPLVSRMPPLGREIAPGGLRTLAVPC